MSFVDLLFPQAELEALGNKWHEPAPKRRKLESGNARVVKAPRETPRIPNSEVSIGQRHHRHSIPASHQSDRSSSSLKEAGPRLTKRSNSDSQALTSPASITTIQHKHAAATAPKSCLPTFIEPSILKNYLRHLHPKDSHRYATPKHQSSNPHIAEDAISSPGSLVPDSTPSPASTDSSPTPADVCEQFRSGPFGHLFDGMRVTDNERDLMEDLLSPAAIPPQDEASSHKRKHSNIQVEVAPADYFDIDESLLRRMFPPSTDKDVKTERDCDVHSSGLSPATEEVEDEENITSHRGIVVYDYDALSVDDFFDLDEAST